MDGGNNQTFYKVLGEIVRRNATAMGLMGTKREVEEGWLVELELGAYQRTRYQLPRTNYSVL